MNPKRIIMVGTMAIAITISGAAFGGKTSAHPSSVGRDQSLPACTPDKAASDGFLQALGAMTDEEVYDALYNGQSLADIAQSHQQDVQSVIDLQVSQLTEQLDTRLAAGFISPAQYRDHKAELAEIVTKSAIGAKLNPQPPAASS